MHSAVCASGTATLVPTLKYFMKVITCASCGKTLDVAYWRDGKSFYHIHCLLAWEAVQIVRTADKQLALHFTTDNPATVE